MSISKAAATSVVAHDDHDHDHDHDHDEENGSMDTLMKLKIVMIVLQFFIVYLGLIPAYSKFFRSSKVVLSLMNTFAGGVFLAMAFIHILPESVEQFNEAMEEAKEEPVAALKGNSTKPADDHAHEEHGGAHVFPLPYLLFFIGYMMVLLIDRVLAGEHGHSHGNQNVGEHSGHSHHDHEGKELAQTDRKLAIPTDNEKNSLPSKNNGDYLHKDQMVVQDIVNDFDQKPKNDFQESGPIILGNQGESVKFQTSKDNQVSDEGAVIHGKPLEKEVLVCGVNISPLILLIALGFHAIFEGIALGMAKELSTFINLMIGVSIHEAVAVISLGVSCGQHQTKSKLAIFLIFFSLSLVKPTGIGIGLGIKDAPIMVTSIVMSLAGGTFIYIACSEILMHEFSDSKHRYWKFLFCVIGCATITLLWLLHEEH